MSYTKQNFVSKNILAASQLNEMDSELKRISDSMECNLIDDLIHGDYYSNGIQAIVNDDGSITLKGTATAEFRYTFLTYTNPIPDKIQLGKSYAVEYSSTNVDLKIWWYKSGTYSGGISAKANRTFTIPVGNDGLLIRLQIASGVTVNETVKVVLKESYDLNEVKEKLDTLSRQTSKQPSLTKQQKLAIQSLIWSYHTYTDKFVFDWNIIKDQLSDKSTTFKDGKARINCGIYIFNILMGRDVNDYLKEETYSSAITKTNVSDFGYYVQYKNSRLANKLANPDSTDPKERYFIFTQPNPDSYEGSYSLNTYYDEKMSSNIVAKQHPYTWQTTSEIARELYELGCEIEYKDLDIGDIIFVRDMGPRTDKSTNLMHELFCWREIAHALFVYNKLDDGTLVLSDCTGEGISIWNTQTTTYESVKQYVEHHLRSAVMYARLPVAFGYESNVPERITTQIS